jgi:hypothetical protein
MKRLLLDCSVVLLVAGGVYFWKHRPVPAPVPAISGARPDLAMPSAKQFSPEAGARRREKTLGETPQLLGQSAVDPTAGNVPDALPDERSPWSDRLRQPWAVGAVVALFIVLYALMTRALRKGPGGHGFTHE